MLSVFALASLALLLGRPGSGQELVGPHRSVLQTADSIDDELDPSTQASVFQQVSASQRVVYPKGTNTLWSIGNINATLELDTNATYADNFRANNPKTWEAGMSRWNISVSVYTYAFVDTVLPATLEARIHSDACALIGQNTLDSVYTYEDNDTYVDLKTDLNVSQQAASASLTYPFLVDYDNARSVVIYSNNNAVACSDMIPPFPDFPNEWMATIEMNRVDLATTWAMQQTYSQSRGKIRMDVHSKGASRVLLQDIVNNQFWIITQPNSTYPHGACRQRKLWSGLSHLFDNATSELISTAQLLHFTEDEGPEYIPGLTNVRGIPCEEWSLEQQYGNASFATSFFFPVNEWLVAREDYHRLLKRVYMNGTYNDEPFETYMEYVNFQPYISSYALLDLCSIAPQGHNCGCDKSSTSAALADQSGVLIEGNDGSCSIPRWFISAQSRPYILLSLVGFFGGVAITAAAAYLYYSRFVGVKPQDRMGHTRFVDETPASAFKI